MDGPILFVKPQAIKGVDLLGPIAARLPERQFVVAGTASKRTRARLQQHANITCQGWVDDMDGLYCAASLLLAPAQIPEPFGRVFVEAGLHVVLLA